MALEYRLNIESKKSLALDFEKYLSQERISFERENLNTSVCYNLFKILGFLVSFIVRDNCYFSYLVREDESLEKEWDYSSVISFRLDKFYDNSLAKLNMIKICGYILNNTKDDAILLFNGDILVLERINGVVKVNNNFGFWN